MQHTSRGLSGPLTFGWSVPQHLCLRFGEGCFEHLQFMNRCDPDTNMTRRQHEHHEPPQPLVDRWGDLDPQKCVPANSLTPGRSWVMMVMGRSGMSHVAPLARAAHRWPAGPWPSKTPYKATRPAEIYGTNRYKYQGFLWCLAKHNHLRWCCDMLWLYCAIIQGHACHDSWPVISKHLQLMPRSQPHQPCDPHEHMASLRHIIWLQNVARWKHINSSAANLASCCWVTPNHLDSALLDQFDVPLHRPMKKNKRGRHGLLWEETNAMLGAAIQILPTATNTTYLKFKNVWGWNTGNAIFHQLCHSIAWSTCIPNWFESARLFFLAISG